LIRLVELGDDFERKLLSLLPESIRGEPMCWYRRSADELIGDTEKAGYLFTLREEYWYFSGRLYEKIIID
jgi:hypothetical protein